MDFGTFFPEKSPLAIVKYWSNYADSAEIPVSGENGWEILRSGTEEQEVLACSHPGLGFQFELHCRALPDGFELFLPRESLKETYNRWHSIRLLPDLCRTHEGAEGYYLLPQQSGVLCRFRNKRSAVYEIGIYGNGLSECNMPVYGMSDGKTLLGVILREGYCDALLHLETARGAHRTYRLAPVFQLRYELSVRRQNMPMVNDEIRIRVRRRPLNGRSGAAVLAELYREERIAAGEIVPLKTRAAENPVLAEALRSPEIRIRMGSKWPFPAEVMEQTPENEPSVHAFCTFRQVEGIVDVNVEQQVQRPEIEITPNRVMMAKYGVTMSDFSKMVNVSIPGVVVSEVYEDGVPYNLTLRVKEEDRNTIAGIRDLLIDTNAGKVPLSYVADVKSSTTYNSINRENARRRIVVSANVENRDLVGAVNDIKEKISSTVDLPEGYYINYGGQFESEQAASRTLAAATILALIVIVLLLYQEFHNFKESLIILVNIPLAMIGGIFILWCNSGELNIPAIIGFISLLGITTRNGMLLMSRYNQLEEEGVSLSERIRIGSTDRLLPIIMTALTSALALIPIVARGTEPGNEIQSPMAVVILGGLFSSTLLNIFVVPIIYYLANRKKECSE